MLLNLPALALFLAAFPSVKLPFHIEATEDAAGEFPGAPHVQSFSFGQWKGRWVFIGGRIAGYHNFGGGTAEFLPRDANQEIWVVDTTVRPAKTYHVAIATLPAALTPLKDEWTATGQLYYQDGSTLYIGGGYGQDHNGNWVTYPVISAVDLPQLIDGVMHGRLPSFIPFAETPLVQSAGGELIKLPDGYFYLVMGHSFQGNYTAFEGHSEHNSDEASQTYLNEIRRLSIKADAHGKLVVRLAKTYRDETEFHRRDLNVAPIVTAKGVGIAAYGGVFTPETQLSYSHPIYLLPDSQPAVDVNFEQKMNAYACAKLLIYDQANQTMYTSFLGGVSRFWWDPEGETYRENTRVGDKSSKPYLDGMQWSDQISTLRKVMAKGKEETTETVQSHSLPGFLGTAAVFIPGDEVSRASPGTALLDLDALRGKRTLVGYIYGGIQAFPYAFPYSKSGTPYNAGAVASKPSGVILKVYVEAER
jgi:hypothetical protein